MMPLHGTCIFSNQAASVFASGGFHHAHDLACGEIAEAAIGLDDRVVLGRLGQLVDLLTLHRTGGSVWPLMNFAMDALHETCLRTRRDARFEIVCSAGIQASDLCVTGQTTIAT